MRLKWAILRTMSMKALILAASIGLRVRPGAVAAGPSAIGEDVNASGAGVAFMDYVKPGRVIRLGAKGTLTLGYLRSCLRETITGGKGCAGAQQTRRRANEESLCASVPEIDALYGPFPVGRTISAARTGSRRRRGRRGGCRNIAASDRR